jgi:hypothetical protein
VTFPTCRAPRWRAALGSLLPRHAVPGFQEGLHVELRLRVALPAIGPDRARAPRKASAFEARAARPSAQMRRADFDVVAAACERAHRTGAKAWASDARVAGARPSAHSGKRERLSKGKRAAITVPKAIFGMNEQTERRTMQGLRAHGPALERPIRRAAERIKRPRAASPRERIDDAP